MSPWSKLKQGNNVNFDVVVIGENQVYISKIELQPKLMYQWLPSFLYYKKINWPDEIPRITGGRDEITVSTTIPKSLDGAQGITLNITYEYTKYNENTDVYEPETTLETVPFTIDLPSNPQNDTFPEFNVGQP